MAEHKPKPHSVSSYFGLELSYESMEDELTCPVCLELYADPLMLPCSHSVCKKCLHDILDSRTRKKQRHAKKDALLIECPSCRKELPLGKERLSTLPKNLALENVVIKYTEERSKSIRKSLSLDAPAAADLAIPAELVSVFPPDSSTSRCELCEGGSPQPAVWLCEQCEVRYCHACLSAYHPRRGALARHKIRQASDEGEQALLCSCHSEEAATLYCASCESPACHLCVCEGEGLHAGHRMLAPKTAASRLQETINKTRDETDWIVATALEQQCKVDTRADEIKELHNEAKTRVEQQYERLLKDITQALKVEQEATLANLNSATQSAVASINTYTAHNTAFTNKVEELSAACQELATIKHFGDTLRRAKSVSPLETKLAEYQKEADVLKQEYENTIKDNSAKITLQSGVGKFSNNAVRTLRSVFDSKSYVSLVPHIISPSTSPTPVAGSDTPTPRIHNKTLTTWGFTSTTFTGEQLSASCSWTVTIEKNVGHVGLPTAGYIFGIGVASEVLNVKDLVGNDEKSHGIVCNAGLLCFGHEGQHEKIVKLDSLPISVTISVNMEHSDYVVLTYKLDSSTEGQGLSLLGKRVIADNKLKKQMYPVFTVSQRVKLLFPTCV